MDEGSAEAPWAASPEAVAAALEVDPRRGLSADEVVRRRARVGPNALRAHASDPWWRILIRQLQSLLVGLLAVAALLAFAFGDTAEGAAVLVVIAINTLLGFVTEWRAVRSMEALRDLDRVDALVRRDGAEQLVDAEALVPGDVLLLREGQVVTADARVVAASRLRAAEAALTGESVPVGKTPDAVDADTALADRRDMVFKGTAIPGGVGEAIVTATGMATELGRISELVATAAPQSTPLQDRLDALGRRLVGVTLLLVAVLVGLGAWRGQDLLLVVETAVALAVATVPEGLPVVATIALARGMRRMARQHALVERLASVETLGATTVILTDKTGTLTENRMAVVRLAVAEGDVAFDESADPPIPPSADIASSPALHRLLEDAALCNDAAIGDDGEVGDPTETALLRAARRIGLERSVLLASLPQRGEEPFDSAMKKMATWHAEDGGLRVAVKGGTDAVLEGCTRQWPDSPLDREVWHRRHDALAAQGLRVLAVAEGRRDAALGEAFSDLALVGLVALQDPPRSDVADAIAACHRAGIAVVMVTGDHPVTGVAIAREVGLASPTDEAVSGRELATLGTADRARLLATRVFARTSPEQKLDLIAMHQEAGEVVAMLGDGVNDAPAIRKADIGVAMGLRGTQVAREAADMVLQDDRLATVVVAVEQGRVIFRNIRQFVVYLMSCNASEVLVVGGAALVDAPLPLLPLQILYLNLVTDVFPALALGVGDTEEDVLGQPPRPADEPVLTRERWVEITVGALGLGALTLSAFAWALFGAGLSEGAAVSTAFLTLSSVQIAHVFNMASPTSGLLRNEVTRNPWTWGAVLLCALLLVAAVHLPVLSDVLALEDPGADGWLAVAGAVALTLGVGQVARLARGRAARRRGRAAQAGGVANP